MGPKVRSGTRSRAISRFRSLPFVLAVSAYTKDIAVWCFPCLVLSFIVNLPNQVNVLVVLVNRAPSSSGPRSRRLLPGLFHDIGNPVWRIRCRFGRCNHVLGVGR